MIVKDKRDCVYGEVFSLSDVIDEKKTEKVEDAHLYMETEGGKAYYKVSASNEEEAIKQISNGVVLGLLYTDEEVKKDYDLRKDRTNYFVLYYDDVESPYLMDHIKLLEVKDCKWLYDSILSHQIGGKLMESGMKNVFADPNAQKGQADRCISNVWPDMADRAQIVLSILARYDYGSATAPEKEILSRTRHNMVDLLMEKARQEVYSTYGYDPFVADYMRADHFDSRIAKTITYVSNSNVREYAEFFKKCKKMVKEGSLVDAIEFYKSEPQKVKAKYADKGDEVKKKSEERHKRQQQREKEKEKKFEQRINDSRDGHYKL